MRPTHAELAHAHDIDADDVMVLDDSGVRASVWKSATPVDCDRTGQNLEANVAVGADNVATKELGGGRIENIDALTIALKKITAVDAAAAENHHSAASLKDCGSAVVLDVKRAEIHLEIAAVDVDAIVSILQDADSLVRRCGHGGIGANSDGYAVVLIVLDGTVLHDEGGGHLHVQAITGIALDRTVDNRSVGTLI